MNDNCLSTEQPTFDYEVGYIIAYDDGRRDRFGQFPLAEPEPEQIAIIQKLVELEPTITEASYIYSNIRLQQQYYVNSRTIEFKKDDIKTLLRRLARPGIIHISKYNS
ncbi:MAG: hypothetical protein J0I20_23870 [Chloroflexi bacterium]|nr:hypothetical protein [Chloroflexota bacterium]OJW04109.1 MAG: hypothetical protein BGO39_06355 [Chloroflexi bacterium 54-19]